jgi:hypothetical protein
VVPRAGVAPSPAALRAHLRQALELEGVALDFVELDALPRRPDGAVDEARLPALEEGGVPYEPPATEAERSLAKLWTEMLGVARAGRRDNFFDLGGHSLLAFQAVAEIEKRLGQRLSPRVLLLNTLEQTAALLQPRAAAPEPPPTAAGLTAKLLDQLKKRLTRS